ncbi:MAG TPA: adenylate cyclase regulatory domain-containing protein [Actinomycetota bacterium]
MVRTEGASVELTIEDVAGRAGVDLAYVRRLVDLGALGPEGDGYREKDAHVTALLHMWEDAGLSAESILAAAESGELSLDFLESPGWELPPRLDRTYRELAEERSMPVDLLQAIQRAMGFVPPEPDDLARPDDVVIADLVRVALDIGGSGDAIRRLFRVYADNLRRLALAEADLYVEQIERPSRSAGTSEPELMRRGSRRAGHGSVGEGHADRDLRAAPPARVGTAFGRDGGGGARARRPVPARRADSDDLLRRPHGLHAPHRGAG